MSQNREIQTMDEKPKVQKKTASIGVIIGSTLTILIDSMMRDASLGQLIGNFIANLF